MIVQVKAALEAANIIPIFAVTLAVGTLARFFNTMAGLTVSDFEFAA